MKVPQFTTRVGATDVLFSPGPPTVPPPPFSPPPWIPSFFPARYTENGATISYPLHIDIRLVSSDPTTPVQQMDITLDFLGTWIDAGGGGYDDHYICGAVVSAYAGTFTINGVPFEYGPAELTWTSNASDDAPYPPSLSLGAALLYFFDGPLQFSTTFYCDVNSFGGFTSIGIPNNNPEDYAVYPVAGNPYSLTKISPYDYVDSGCGVMVLKGPFYTVIAVWNPLYNNWSYITP